MHPWLPVDPPKHLGYLFGASCLGLSRTTAEDEEVVGIIRKVANLQLKGKMIQWPSHQKASLPTRGPLKALCTKGDVFLWNIQIPIAWKISFWSCYLLWPVSLQWVPLKTCYVPRPPLIAFVNWMDPAPDMFINNCLFLDFGTVTWKGDCV